MAGFRRACYRKMYVIRRSLFLFYFLYLFYALYLITGAFMFAALEAPLDRQITEMVEEKMQKLIMKQDCLTRKELLTLLHEMVDAGKKGYIFTEDGSEESNWGFAQSLFFAATIVTTIGYGHVTPQSAEGKLFCMIYSAIGIPLTLILGGATVERIMIPSTHLKTIMHHRLKNHLSPFKIDLIHLMLMSCVTFLIILVFPTIIFKRLESKWTYLDAFYFCFITMTTIGLGDYIPGDAPFQKNRTPYKIMCTVYLLITFIGILFLVNLYNQIGKLNMSLYFMVEKNNRVTDPERAPLNETSSIGRSYTEYNSTDMILPSKVVTPIQDDDGELTTVTISK